jgi:hypothetical protein
MKAFSDEEKTALTEAKHCASRYLPSLLSFTSKDGESMRKRAFNIRSEVDKYLKSNGVSEMTERIAENYGILTSATEMVGEL